MQSYDLNGDGMVMGIEETPAAIEAEQDWSGDTGRQLAAVIGVFYVVIWYTLVMLVLLAAESIVKVLVRRDKPKTS